MKAKIFGTDGIRGRAGSGWLSVEGAAWIGYAVGSVLGKAHDWPALLGHDGRRSGPRLEAALACGLAAAGLRSESAGLIPTPGLAWLTKHQQYTLGIMVSASHNPAGDNGIKVFDHSGDKLPDDVQAEIEAILHGERPGVDPDALRPEHNPRLEDSYLGHLERTWGKGLDLSGLHVMIDCANGAGSRTGPKVLARLGAQVHALADEPDGENINRDCGSTHPEALQAAVRQNKADCGIALDGDGDRCLMVDETGRLVDGDELLLVLGRQAKQQGSLPDDRLVATVMSNRGLHRALRSHGIGVEEVGVGDRFVVEAMRRQSLALGGEQSGHVILGARNDFIGDGMVTALAVLRVMRETGQSLGQLTAEFESMPQVLLNVPVASKPDLSSLPGLFDVVREYESVLGEDGRILLRYSGTENLARVMVEGPDAGVIQRQASDLASRIQEAIGQHVG
ncbi:MAG: phosphoglucosamine mutase [Planctomycetota bacterium]